ncbi:MAG: hypothetical protein R3E36_00105 [Nitrosomonas sp.]|nr:hypothetical protein [Nitrosomonas sp.]
MPPEERDRARRFFELIEHVYRMVVLIPFQGGGKRTALEHARQDWVYDTASQTPLRYCLNFVRI